MKLCINERKVKIEWDGVYEGRAFVITYTDLGFYCAYVDVTGTSFADKNYEEVNIVCHGGLTFSGVCSFDGEERQCIGWDYAHEGDYVAGLGVSQGRQYTIDDIVEDCFAVIDQINAKEAK